MHACTPKLALSVGQVGGAASEVNRKLVQIHSKNTTMDCHTNLCEWCSGRKRGGREKGEEGIEGEGGKNQERKGRRQEEILNNQVLILCQYPPSPPLAPPSHAELKSLVELTCTLSSGAFTGLSLMFLVRMNPLRPFSSLVLTPIL